MCRVLFKVFVLFLVFFEISRAGSEGIDPTDAVCTASQVSFFNYLKCKDGFIGIGESCECGQGNCRLDLLRSYLPESTTLLDMFADEKLKKCDDAMTRAFSDYILGRAGPNEDGILFERHQGYPQDEDCSSGTCHTPSFGKYVRYNSLMEYHRFTGRGNDTLVDIEYPLGFRWSQNIRKCEEEVQFAGWNCAFQNLSTPLPTNKVEGSISTLIEPDLVKLMNKVRLARPNNVAQVVLYGRLLYLLARPSNLVVGYLAKNLVSTNPHHHSRDSNLPTVSMHVRQGDSCGIMITELPSSEHGLDRYINDPREASTKRPCFSVDVYMQALKKIREMYNVRRVYLATDSEEMLQRIQHENEYNWVFVNSSREIFDFKHGMIDFFENDNYETITLGAAADLAIMRKGDIFLGCFTGHFSKLAFYLMAGKRMRVPPFWSLDYSLACDTTDVCTDEHVKSKAFTIEDMITWAPECRRDGGLEWGPQGNQDPCGIYSS